MLGTVMEIVGVTKLFTVMAIALELTVSGVAQFALDANSQVTISLFASALLLYVLLLVPTLLPFSFH